MDFIHKLNFCSVPSIGMNRISNRILLLAFYLCAALLSLSVFIINHFRIDALHPSWEPSKCAHYYWFSSLAIWLFSTTLLLLLHDDYLHEKLQYLNAFWGSTKIIGIITQNDLFRKKKEAERIIFQPFFLNFFFVSVCIALSNVYLAFHNLIRMRKKEAKFLGRYCWCSLFWQTSRLKLL